MLLENGYKIMMAQIKDALSYLDVKKNIGMCYHIGWLSVIDIFAFWVVISFMFIYAPYADVDYMKKYTTIQS